MWLLRPAYVDRQGRSRKACSAECASGRVGLGSSGRFFPVERVRQTGQSEAWLRARKLRPNCDLKASLLLVGVSIPSQAPAT